MILLVSLSLLRSFLSHAPLILVQKVKWSMNKSQCKDPLARLSSRFFSRNKSIFVCVDELDETSSA